MLNDRGNEKKSYISLQANMQRLDMPKLPAAERSRSRVESVVVPVWSRSLPNPDLRYSQTPSIKSENGIATHLPEYPPRFPDLRNYCLLRLTVRSCSQVPMSVTHCLRIKLLLNPQSLQNLRPLSHPPHRRAMRCNNCFVSATGQ
jgi:hypothetical protein